MGAKAVSMTLEDLIDPFSTSQECPVGEDLMDRVTYKLLFFLILQVQVTYRSVLKDPVS